MKVQKQIELRKRPGIGRVWATVGVYKNRATAERQAALTRIDARHQRPQETRTARVRITP